jgi:hypothetical protein
MQQVYTKATFYPRLDLATVSVLAAGELARLAIGHLH